MFCSQCGQCLEESALFCCQCGSPRQHQGEKETKESFAHLNKKKEANHPSCRSSSWASLFFKVLFVVMVAGSLIAGALLFSTDNPEEVIQGQLNALAENKITEAYYTYTSKSFQKETTLEEFKDFIRAHPLLKQGVTPQIEERFTKNKLEIFKGFLKSSENHKLFIEYHLEKEGQKWKILSIETAGGEHSVHPALEFPGAVFEPSKKAFQAKGSPLASVFPLALVDKEQVKSQGKLSSQQVQEVVKSFLDLIKGEKFQEAYETMTSTSFQEVTSFEEFQNFFKAYPIFSKWSSYDLPHFDIQEKILILKGTIESRDQVNYALEIRLVQDSSGWKILHLQVDMKPTTKEQGALEQKKGEVKKVKEAFTKFLVGTSLDEKGRVINPQEKFSLETKEIYLNVFYQEGKRGTLVTVLFEHQDTQSEITPVSAFYEVEGDSYLSFVFSPPKEGWPKGIYQIRAVSANGPVGSYSFKVE